MANRYDLIARKQELLARMERVRRELARERALGDDVNDRRLRKLENQLEQLMAEEYRLRLEIDRST